MKTKFGFELINQNFNRNSDYRNIVLRIYALDDLIPVRWNNLLEISWQSDNVHTEWYGFTLNLHYSLYQSEFALAVKFLQKIQAGEVYQAHPEQFINWLIKTVKAVQVVRNNRQNHIVTLEQFLKVENLPAYRFYANGGEYGYVELIEAVNKSAAWDIVNERYANSHYQETVARWYLEEEFEPVGRFVTVENWLNYNQF